MLLTYLKFWLPMWLVYIGFTADLEPANLALGALLSLAVVVMVRPQLSPMNLSQLLMSLATLLLYVFVVAWEVLKNGIVVARIVVTPSLPIKPGVIGIDAGTDSPMAQAFSAHSITITPGEFVLEMDDAGTLYIHSLDMDRTEPSAQDDQARRMRWLNRIV